MEQIGDNLVAIVGLWGVFCTFIGVLMVINQIFYEEFRRTFATVCQMQFEDIEKYHKVYIDIFPEFGFDSINTNQIVEGYNIIDRDYCYKYIHGTDKENRLKMDFEELFLNENVKEKYSMYKFPLIYKQNWLRSKNGLLEITQQLDPPLQASEGKNPLAAKAERFFKTFGLQLEGYPPFLASLGKKIWDGLSFDLYEVLQNTDKMQLKFIKGRYYNFVKYYELALKELYFNYYCDMKYKHSWLYRPMLPKKKTLRNCVNIRNILNYKYRPIKLGINVFVIMCKDEDKQKYCTFIQRRGQDQVEYPGFYHVVPAGTFDPLSDWDKETVKNQFDFKFTILRELLEELYNLEEADKNKDVDPFNIFRMGLPEKSDFKPGKYLLKYDTNKGVITEYHCEIILTGFLIDLVALKPELTAVLLIRSDKLYKKSKKIFHGNWEGPVKEFDLDDDDSEYSNFLKDNFNVDKILPAGAAAIAEGIDYYFKEVRKTVNS